MEIRIFILFFILLIFLSAAKSMSIKRKASTYLGFIPNGFTYLQSYSILYYSTIDSAASCQYNIYK